MREIQNVEALNTCYQETGVNILSVSDSYRDRLRAPAALARMSMVCGKMREAHFSTHHTHLRG